MFWARTKKQENRPDTFCVDDVVPANTPIATESLARHVRKRFKPQVLLLPEPEKPVINPHLDVPSSAPLRKEMRAWLAENAVSRCHPLIDAVATAFSEHRPLVLSPDSIWLAIEQGFAHHILENAEAMRHRLVRHQGSRELVTELAGFTLPAFDLAITDFSRQIREASDPVLHEALICDFSTTTPAIRTASEVVLMDCYSSYFTYAMNFICGIPKITLLGSLDDWQRIRARVEVLETFDLGWWIDRLRPVLDEFVRTAKDGPKLEFWQAICKPKKAYGAEKITGWITDLFPYLGDSPKRFRNPVFASERRNWAIPVEDGIPTSSFPSGLCRVPVKLNFPGGSTMPIDLVAGFLAVEQDLGDRALSPVISWAVTERAPEKPSMIG